MVFGCCFLCFIDCIFFGQIETEKNTIYFSTFSTYHWFSIWKIFTDHFSSWISIYILVRNFLCVGIPYFCIGNIIRERKYAEKCNKRILQIMIIVFAISSFLERFILVKAGANATRDHYISTTFLAISFFVYALKSNWNNEILALIGRRYSTWLYIMHPIFITLLSMVAGKFGVKSIYRCVAPIVVYCVTLVFLIVLQKVKIVTKSK